MTINIIFNDGTRCRYNSFDEVIELNNYNDITAIYCYGNNIFSLPELPNSLKYLYCEHNNLSSLPQLPNSLIYLDCTYNNLSNLPQLPNSLTYLICNNNNLSILPQLPNSLKNLNCSFNNLSDLPYDIDKINYLEYAGNPVCKTINKYVKPLTQFQLYLRDEKKKYIESCNKIGEWYLECKYNPKYKQCRKIIKLEYDEMYN